MIAKSTSLCRDEMAFAIYLKRLPPERYLNDKPSNEYFAGKAEEAYALADVFIKKGREEYTVTATVTVRLPGDEL